MYKFTDPVTLLGGPLGRKKFDLVRNQFLRIATIVQGIDWDIFMMSQSMFQFMTEYEELSLLLKQFSENTNFEESINQSFNLEKSSHNEFEYLVNNISVNIYSKINQYLLIISKYIDKIQYRATLLEQLEKEGKLEAALNGSLEDKDLIEFAEFENKLTSDLETFIAQRHEYLIESFIEYFKSQKKLEELEKSIWNIILNDISLLPEDFSFDSIMNSKVSRWYFRKFLESEFATENFDFFMAVINYKEIPEINEIKLKTEALRIYEKWVKAGCDLEINIDFLARDEIAKKILTPNKNIFDNAFNHIKYLLDNNTFPRFLNSEMFKKLNYRCKQSSFTFEYPEDPETSFLDSSNSELDDFFEILLSEDDEPIILMEDPRSSKLEISRGKSAQF